MRPQIRLSVGFAASFIGRARDVFVVRALLYSSTSLETETPLYGRVGLPLPPGNPGGSFFRQRPKGLSATALDGASSWQHPL
jgi:hypothetical protein